MKEKVKLWEKTDYFCPDCGKESMVWESPDADYYVGETYICVACELIFNLLPTSYASGSEKELIQKLKKEEERKEGGKE